MLTPVLIVGGLLVLFMALTTMSAQRRGDPFVLSVLSGLCFPATWVAWFVVDNLRAGRRPFRGR